MVATGPDGPCRRGRTSIRYGWTVSGWGTVAVAQVRSEVLTIELTQAPVGRSPVKGVLPAGGRVGAVGETRPFTPAACAFRIERGQEPRVVIFRD
jgi:hypothetical protein